MEHMTFKSALSFSQAKDTYCNDVSMMKGLKYPLLQAFSFEMNFLASLLVLACQPLLHCYSICHKMSFSTFLLLSFFCPFFPRHSWTQELLMFKLSGRPTSPNNPPHSMNFDPASEGHADTGGFNPLYQFDHIGKKKLDQVCH